MYFLLFQVEAFGVAMAPPFANYTIAQTISALLDKLCDTQSVAARDLAQKFLDAMGDIGASITRDNLKDLELLARLTRQCSGRGTPIPVL
jgi:hypothetical protein